MWNPYQAGGVGGNSNESPPGCGGGVLKGGRQKGKTKGILRMGPWVQTAPKFVGGETRVNEGAL